MRFTIECESYTVSVKVAQRENYFCIKRSKHYLLINNGGHDEKIDDRRFLLARLCAGRLR